MDVDRTYPAATTSGIASPSSSSSPSSKQQVLNAVESELVKQSSFSTSDSSIAIPMGEESTTDQRWSGKSVAAKLFRFRKSPLQVFSKEYANAPVSILTSKFTDLILAVF